jgi:hypothetical protein
MAAVLESGNGGRGAALLLVHCSALPDADRVPARARLEALVGRDLARLLLFALTR